MTKKRTLALVTSGLLVVAAALPAAASAYEWDIAMKRGNPPSGMPCVKTKRSKVCFQSKGDKIWVKDRKPGNKKPDHIFRYWPRWKFTGNTPY